MGSFKNSVLNQPKYNLLEQSYLKEIKSDWKKNIE